MNKELLQAIQMNAMGKELTYIYHRVNALLDEFKNNQNLTKEEIDLYYKIIDIMKDASLEREFYELALREKYKDILNEVSPNEGRS